MSGSILKVEGLSTSFKVGSKYFRAVDDISFEISSGETLGLVGESGSGKSVTSLSILNLIPSPGGRIETGSIKYNGSDLLTLDKAHMRKIRGHEISMIFQEPMTSLNPVFTIGDQVDEVFKIHRGFRGASAREHTIEMLDLVKIPSPKERASQYPHQLSGGMRQRVMIAMALACQPKLLIADEPTTALDVTIQAQILDLIEDLQAEFNMAVLLITHDLGVVAETCDRVVVLYGGSVVEQAAVGELFSNPCHPYTKGLLASVPKIGRKVDELPTISGTVPPLGSFPSGCKFQNRCPLVVDKCRQQAPKLKPVSKRGHQVACWQVEGSDQ